MDGCAAGGKVGMVGQPSENFGIKSSSRPMCFVGKLSVDDVVLNGKEGSISSERFEALLKLLFKTPLEVLLESAGNLTQGFAHSDERFDTQVKSGGTESQLHGSAGAHSVVELVGGGHDARMGMGAHGLKGSFRSDLIMRLTLIIKF